MAEATGPSAGAAPAVEEDAWLTPAVLVGLRARDPRAQEEFYARYFDSVFNYLRLLFGGDPHLAEDAAQDVVISAFKALPRFEQRGAAVRAWLFQIARRFALQHMRTVGRGDRALVRLRERWEGECDWAADPFTAASEREMVRQLGRLKLEYREVLFLRYVLSNSHKEIAVVLGRSDAAVRKLQGRAEQALRRELGSGGRERVGVGRELRVASGRRRVSPRVLVARQDVARHWR
jgi:RNA polymerase sigma-70 factor (ECF subfamily)